MALLIDCNHKEYIIFDCIGIVLFNIEGKTLIVF